jgi:hypothetical protein
MAAATTISNAAAIAALDAVVDLFDVGGAGTVVIYDGTQPTNPDVAVSTQTALATITLNTTAFGDAADDTGKATATVNESPALTDSSADNTGTASWFRVFNNGGTPVLDGSAGEDADSTDMTLDNKSINSGQSVTITDWTISMSET